MLMMPTIIAAVLATSGPAVAPAALEIHASLSGYNLLWPTPRCCAFALRLSAGGELTITLELEEGASISSSQLSADDVASLRRVLEQARFFRLPSAVGSMPIDGDEHRMQVRLGNKSHAVTLYDWPDNWNDAPYLSKQELECTRRAHAVWSALRALVKDPRATVP